MTKARLKKKRAARVSKALNRIIDHLQKNRLLSYASEFDKARDEMMSYGSGAVFVDVDGTVKHVRVRDIDPGRVP